MDSRIRNLKTYPMVLLQRRKEELLARGLEVFDFGTGDPREPTPAFIREALKEAVPEVSQYPSVAGELGLREAFAGFFERRFGVRLDPDREVLPTRGSKEAIFHLPLVLIDPSEDRRLVVLPEPGYPVMEIGGLYAGAELWVHRLDEGNGYLMHPEEVPPEVLDRAALVWLNYPNNPTGREMPAEVFETWVRARDRHGFVLCSDECYVDLYFGEPPRSLLEFGRKGCLAFHSLSKRSGMTGYRSGIVAGDPDLLTLYRAQRAAFGQAMTVWVQRASAAAWNDDRHAEERRRVFAAKRNLMAGGLAARGLEVFGTSATFYLWLRVPGGFDGEAYAARLAEEGILVSPGPFFGRGQEDRIRVALVPDLEACGKALERWPDARGS